MFGSFIFPETWLILLTQCLVFSFLRSHSRGYVPPLSRRIVKSTMIMVVVIMSLRFSEGKDKAKLKEMAPLSPQNHMMNICLFLKG